MRPQAPPFKRTSFAQLVIRAAQAPAGTYDFEVEGRDALRNLLDTLALQLIVAP